MKRDLVKPLDIKGPKLTMPADSSAARRLLTIPSQLVVLPMRVLDTPEPIKKKRGGKK